jgi:hypothetical protein
MSRTEKQDAMKLRIRRHRFTRADWIGYAVLIMLGGAAGLAALLLPWANEYTREFVNFSLTKPPDVFGVMQTQWGWPVLAAALAALAAAVLLLVLGPRRVTVVLSLVVAAAGAVYALEAIAAADSMIGIYRPGLGLYVTLLTGILLVPIGLASLAVGAAMRASLRHAAATVVSPAPPAPGSAPPS